MLMTQENQALTSQLSSLAYEKEQLFGKLSEYTSSQHSLQQSCRALELERDDIIQTYRSALLEKRRLENDCASLGVSRQESGAQMNEMQGVISELKGQLAAHIASENRYMVEKASLNKHIETLNESLVKCQRRTDAIDADNRRLMQVIHLYV
jgi:chromosome segregation ATPase